MLSASNWAAYVVAGLFLYALARPIIAYYRDPLKLRQYPSPSLLAAITPIWLLKATWSQRRSRILNKAFEQLGDVVRVAPDHLIFNDPAAIKDIYGVLAISQGIAKDEFYDRAAGEAHDLVQLRDRHEHSSRRRALANAFAAKTVVNMEDVIRRTFYQLLQRLDCQVMEASSPVKKDVNLRHWLNFFTLDVIGDMGFGIPMGFLKNMSDSTDGETHGGQRYQVAGMIDALHRGVRYSLTLANLPSRHFAQWFKFAVNTIRPLAYRLGSKGAEDFENICIGKLRTRIDQGPPTRTSADFMHFILGQGEADAKELTPDRFHSLVADSVMMMNAGSDTTAAALTSTIWFLLRNPQAVARLREELAPLAPENVATPELDESVIFSYDTVKDLPYLRACIDESLRLRPPIAYQLPRLVSRPVTIAGHQIMPGTVVAVAPYSVHRHPKLFRDPNEYKPERWIDHDEQFPQQREHLKQYNIVFSQGSRACIGRHLAIVELQILVSTLVMRYDMSLTDPQQYLEVFERFNSNPGPMHVTFHRRAGAS